METFQRRKRKTGTQPAPTPLSIEMDGINFASDAQLNHYIRLKLKGMAPTQFVDIDALRALYVYPSVKVLFELIGWDRFLNIKAVPTYNRLTLEFLATLKVNMNAKTITFRAYGV